MPSYRQVLRMAARRINAITGTNKVDLEANYTTFPLTVVEIGNTDFTYSMIVDNMLAVMGRIVRAIASSHSHPYRSYYTTQTANIATGGLIPNVSSGGNPIIGEYGAVRDASTGKVLTKQPVQLIESLLLGIADGSVKGTYYYYDMVENRLIHTVTNAVIDVCTFNVTTELATVIANGEAPIPDALLDLAWTGLVASLMLDDEFVSQAQIHGQYFEQELANVAGGSSQVAPAPRLTANAAPGIS